MGTLIVIGIVTAFNLIIFKIKFEQGRYGDLALDFVTFAFLTAFFGHTLGGMMIAMIAGTLVSLYLFIFPPEFG